ncbi:MAG: PAS domain-containing protein [Bacteroidales bacterium]
MAKKYTYEELEQRLQDIREKYANKIKQERKRYEVLFNNTGAATCLFGDDMIIALCNKEFEVLSGYSKVEIEGEMKWSDFFDNQDLQKMTEYHRQRQKNTGNLPTEYEFVFIDRIGERKNILLKLGFELDSKECVASLTNITQLKNIQWELKENHRMMETLLANIPGMVYRCRNYKKWSMLYVSEGCKDVTGYDAEFLLHDKELTYGDIVHPEDQEFVWSVIQQSISENEHFEVEYRIYTAMGSIRWVWERGKIIGQDRNGVELLEGFIMDITNRKEAEIKQNNWNKELEEQVKNRTSQLEKANKELESFSYSVSHDLKAPLRAIEGFSKILEEDYLSQLEGDAKRYLNIIRSNASKMNQLISDLLAFSKLGKKALRIKRIDTKKLVNEVYTELKSEYQQKLPAFTVHQLPEIYADRSMLKIVFSNLISNAFKFSESKENPEIEIGSFKGMNNKQIFYVKDNGIGFNMNYVDKVFGTFQRLHPEEEYKGSGIGLSLVKRVINKHGGKIWVESKQGKGTTFYFFLSDIEKEIKNE